MSVQSTSSAWKTVADGTALAADKTFATTPSSPKENVISEVSCQKQNNCPADILAFRAILARGMATYLAMTKDNATVHANVVTVLRDSAEGAAAQCSGGASGTECGSDWWTSKYDGKTGLSENLSALEVILANMPAKKVETNTVSTTAAVTPTGAGASPTATNGAERTMGLHAWVLVACAAAGALFI